MRSVFVVHDGGGKTHWTRVGNAEENADGSLTVRLEAIPLGGKLVGGKLVGGKLVVQGGAANLAQVLQQEDARKEAVAEDTERLELERTAMGDGDATLPLAGSSCQPLPPFPGTRKGGAKKGKKVVEHRNLQDTHDVTKAVYHADVAPGESIRIFGQYGNRKEPGEFDRTFKVGDVVEHRSYNLSYTGPIRAIGPNTVSVWDNIYNKDRRLKLREFIWRNWDFNAAETAKRNAEWCD